MLISLGLTTTGGIMINWLKLGEMIYNNIPWIHYFPFTFQYLWVPFLYLFTLTLTQSSFKFQKLHIFHFLPFTLIAIRVLIFTFWKSPEEIRAIMTLDLLFNSFESGFYYIVEYIQFYSYTIASLVVVRKYRINIKELHSSVDRISLFWLSYVLYGIILMKSLKLIGAILELTNIMTMVFITIYIIAGILFIIFLSMMFYKGINYPYVFFCLDAKHPNKKYEKTFLSEEIKEKYTSILIQHMENRMPYLDPALTISKLSNQLDIPSHYLSQIINGRFGQNFYDFINSYRVKESIKMLKGDVSKTKTVLEILYETGFNSKSVFNSFFKKYTNMTPTQFRKINNS